MYRVTGIMIIIVLRFFARASPERKLPRGAPPCEFGVEGPMPREGMNPSELPIFVDAVADLGAQFIVASFTPEWNSELARKRGNYIGSEGTVQAYRKFADLCRERKLSFFINQQVTSYCKEGEFRDKAGKDVLAHGDGTHRWDVAGELLATLSRMPEFRGVVYDEAEWNILRRDRNTNGGDDNASSGRIHPYFAVTERLDAFDAYEATVRGAAPVAEAYRKAGVAHDGRARVSRDVPRVRAGGDRSVYEVHEGGTRFGLRRHRHGRCPAIRPRLLRQPGHVGPGIHGCLQVGISRPSAGRTALLAAAGVLDGGFARVRREQLC